MVDCKICENGYCERAKTDRGFVVACNGYIEPKKPQTNADRIRAMSDEELADFLAGIIVKESRLRLKDEGCLLTETQERALRHQLFLTVAQFLKEPVKDGEDDG